MDTAVVGSGQEGPTRSRPGWIAVVAGIAGAVVLAYGANQLGWWWATPLAGVAIGLLVRRWYVVAPCLVAGAVAWGAGLFLGPDDADVTRIARVAAALAGLGPDSASIVLLVTVAYGALLCAVGGWLAVAARAVIPSRSGVARASGTPAGITTERPATPIDAGPLDLSTSGLPDDRQSDQELTPVLASATTQSTAGREIDHG